MIDEDYYKIYKCQKYVLLKIHKIRLKNPLAIRLYEGIEKDIAEYDRKHVDYKTRFDEEIARGEGCEIYNAAFKREMME